MKTRNLSIAAALALSVASCSHSAQIATPRLAAANYPMGVDAMPRNVQIGLRQFFVTPQGQPGGDGSAQRPWDLNTALNQTNLVTPGSVIWVRGGVYKGEFVSKIAGTENAPVVVRAYPGERAILDGDGIPQLGNLRVMGDNSWFWGLEVMNSRKPSFSMQEDVDESDLKPVKAAVYCGANDVKFINLIVHDNGIAISLAPSTLRSEVVGCVVYNNGMTRLDHGIYAQNGTGYKTIRDNMFFNNAGQGVHIWGLRGAIQGFVVEGNLVWNNGELMEGAKQKENIFVGGHQEAARIVIRDNYVYANPTASASGLRLGYNNSVLNQDMLVTGNVVASRIPLKITRWQQAEITGNTLIANGDLGGVLNPSFSIGEAQRGIYLNNNLYRTDAPRGFRVRVEQRDYDFAQWRAATGFDRNSQVAPIARNEAPQVVVRPNHYEPGRAHITVFNWRKAASVDVDLSGQGLANGQRFEVRDAQNYFGAPVFSGTFNNRPVRLPMRGNATSEPLGRNARHQHTDSEFGAFVVLPLDNSPTFRFSGIGNSGIVPPPSPNTLPPAVPAPRPNTVPNPAPNPVPAPNTTPGNIILF